MNNQLIGTVRRDEILGILRGLLRARSDWADCLEAVAESFNLFDDLYRVNVIVAESEVKNGSSKHVV